MERGVLSDREKAEVIHTVLYAVAVYHRLGWAHCGINPDHVFVDYSSEHGLQSVHLLPPMWEMCRTGEVELNEVSWLPPECLWMHASEMSEIKQQLYQNEQLSQHHLMGQHQSGASLGRSLRGSNSTRSYAQSTTFNGHAYDQGPDSDGKNCSCQSGFLESNQELSEPCGHMQFDMFQLGVLVHYIVHGHPVLRIGESTIFEKAHYLSTHPEAVGIAEGLDQSQYGVSMDFLDIEGLRGCNDLYFACVLGTIRRPSAPPRERTVRQQKIPSNRSDAVVLLVNDRWLAKHVDLTGAAQIPENTRWYTPALIYASLPLSACASLPALIYASLSLLCLTAT